MRDRAPSAEFYVRSPFRNPFFIVATSTLSIDLLLCALLLAGGWRHLTLLTVSVIAFAIIYLVAMWRLGLRVHEEIHLLFETGQIVKLEKGSPLDRVLRANTNMLIGGLFTTSIMLGFCLAAIGQVLFSR